MPLSYMSFACWAFLTDQIPSKRKKQIKSSQVCFLQPLHPTKPRGRYLGEASTCHMLVESAFLGVKGVGLEIIIYIYSRLKCKVTCSNMRFVYKLSRKTICRDSQQQLLEISFRDQAKAGHYPGLTNPIVCQLQLYQKQLWNSRKIARKSRLCSCKLCM